MYRGFKLSIDKIGNSTLSGASLKMIGERLYEADKKTVRDDLSQYILSGNFLDASGLQKAWFPKLDADIFISHSHKDKDLAISLSGWLHKNFCITSFIDSSVWGYGDDLLKEIDNRFCKSSTDNNYNYYKRNLSTSHVHMMMASAISSMIDRTEVLFFLNTPNSVSYNAGNTQTESPWLYYELGQSQVIRRRKPNRLLYENRRFSDSMLEKSIGAKYSIDLSHLREISLDDLELWYDECALDDDSGKTLDSFYQLFPGKQVSDKLNG